MFLLIPLMNGTKKARLFSVLQVVFIAISVLFVLLAVHSQFIIENSMFYAKDNPIKMLLEKQVLYCRVAMVCGVISLGISIIGCLFCIHKSLKADSVKVPQEQLVQTIHPVVFAMLVVPIIVIINYALFGAAQYTERRSLKTINQIESNNLNSVTVAITSRISKDATLDAFGYSFKNPALTQVNAIDLSKNKHFDFLFSDDTFLKISPGRIADMDKYSGNNYHKMFEEFDKLYEVFYVEYDSAYGDKMLVMEIKEADK